MCGHICVCMHTHKCVDLRLGIVGGGALDP